VFIASKFIYSTRQFFDYAGTKKTIQGLWMNAGLDGFSSAKSAAMLANNLYCPVANAVFFDQLFFHDRITYTCKLLLVILSRNAVFNHRGSCLITSLTEQQNGFIKQSVKPKSCMFCILS